MAIERCSTFNDGLRCKLEAGHDAPHVMRLDIVDSRTVRDEHGRSYDVLAAIDALPWVRQSCPSMPHEYAHLFKSDRLDYAVVERMLKASNQESYRAYFRGYQSPNRYWDAPDGQRYWLTMYMVNRCLPDSVEPLRLVGPGVGAITGWDGPPYAPNGAHLYEQSASGKWWPTQSALAGGYQPCASCMRTERNSATVATHQEPKRNAAPIATATSGSRTDTPKGRVVRKLLELRAREAPLGSTAYRGVLSQKAIADVADVPVAVVTRAAIELERERSVEAKGSPEG